MAHRTNGFLAGERASRKHLRELARVEARHMRAFNASDFAGHDLHWWDGPPPARLIVEREMEAAVADYRELRGWR